MSKHDSVAETVKSLEELPSLPVVVQKLLVALQNPDYSASEVSSIVNSDPALAGRVLKLVNSPAYGFSQDIQTIDRAVVILGADALKNTVMCAGIVGTMDIMSTDEALESFWRHALYVAVGASTLAARTGQATPDEAFLAGLIHDIGELALTAIKPDEYQIVQALGSHERRLNEKRYLGITHQRAGHVLLSSWALPDNLCAVALMHHSRRAIARSNRPVLAVVALADMLSRTAGMGNEPPTDERLFIPLLRRLNVEVADLGDILRDIDHGMTEKTTFLRLGDEVLGRDAAANVPGGLRVAILSTSKRRVQWIHETLEYHGHEHVSLRSFLDDPTAVDAVLIDPASVAPKQLQRLAPLLRRSTFRTATCGDLPDASFEEVLGTKLPHLELVFSPRELVTIASLEPVC